MRFVILAVLLAAVVTLADAGAALATGTVRVEQTDGSTQVYNNVVIRVTNQTLSLTTADGKGTLVVDKAACSYVGELLRCLPYSMTLDQGGGAHPLDFETGTAYLNPTGASQALALSSTRVPPHGILLAVRSKIGTLITLTGKVDKVTK